MRHIIATTIFATLTTWAFAGCLVDSDDEHVDDAALAISGDDAAVAAACAQHPKKQAVCHIPPGNPANAHTICISVNAVDKHLSQHGDYLGACDPGSGGGDPTSGAGGATSGAGGSSSSASTGSGGGDCSPEYPPCVTTADCDGAQASCINGCCVPYTY